MAVPLSIELIKNTRGKDKATIQGFIYTLAQSTNDIQQWVCEKHAESAKHESIPDKSISTSTSLHVQVVLFTY